MNKIVKIKLFVIAYTIFIVNSTQAAVDLKNGKIQHDKSCTSCHVAKYGKDGSKVYTRENRVVKNHSMLVQRVKACDINTNAGFHDDEVTNVIEYLNSSYYKFKD